MKCLCTKIGEKKLSLWLFARWPGRTSPHLNAQYHLKYLKYFILTLESNAKQYQTKSKQKHVKRDIHICFFVKQSINVGLAISPFGVNRVNDLWARLSEREAPASHSPNCICTQFIPAATYCRGICLQLLPLAPSCSSFVNGVVLLMISHQ